MHAKKVSHKIIDNACSWMHAARRNALAEAVLTALKERRLTVTSPVTLDAMTPMTMR